MDEFIKTIRKNKSNIIIIIAVLMFIFFGFCSAIDVAGKAQISGFKVVFDGEGLGFSRLLSVIILLIPIAIVVTKFVDFKLSNELRENFDAICFVAGALLCLILIFALPAHISLAWGSWLYILVALCGIAVSRIDAISKAIHNA